MRKPATALIELARVEKTYWLGATAVRALRGVSLTIREGEFVAIMGHSGSGKSTLMHVLGLLDAYDAGTYRLAGEDTSALDEDARADLRARTIGFVFQQFNLLPRMNAGENIELPLIYGGGRRDGLAPLARALQLGHRLRHRPGELSGGQQQRVAIARALMNRPRLILADEPTGNLDSATQREIMNLLSRLNRAGLTVILVTHEEDVARYARRVIRMRDGRIVTDVRQAGAGATLRPGSGRAAGRLPLALGGRAPVGEPPSRFARLLVRRLPPALASLPVHLREAGRSLAANKVRASLSTLGITIGVAAVIAMLALGAGARSSMQQSLSRFGTNLLSVRPNWWRADGRGRSGITRLTIEDAAAIPRAHAAILRSVPMVWGRAEATAQGKDHTSSLIGCTPDYADLRNYRPVAGRFFTARENVERARVLLLGQTVMRELFGEDGNPVGRTVRLNRVPFSVIGILPEKGANAWNDPDDMVLMPLATAMYRVTGDRFVSGIDVEVKPASNMDEVIEAVKAFLARRYHLKGGNEDSFDIRNEVAFRQAFSEMTQTMTWLLGIIAGISLLVGGIGIMNIMLVSVTERTREIGLRKAVGARHLDILQQFLVEATAISLTGGVLGVLLGAGTALVLSLAMKWSVSVTPLSVALSFGFSAAVGVGFGYWPARRAAALHPAEALRYE